MANGRGGRSRVDTGRDPGRFIGLPVSVLESAAYLGLSANARSLLLEVALQFHGDDNGRMLLSRAHLRKRGWNSSDMIDKGKRELLAAELIFETVKGQRPNKASWYAMTWRRLDKLAGFDFGTAQSFEQGTYMRRKPLVAVPNPSSNRTTGRAQTQSPPGEVLNPCGGSSVTPTVPPHGTEAWSPGPPHGSICGKSPGPPAPRHGHPLEMPSAGVAAGPARTAESKLQSAVAWL